MKTSAEELLSNFDDLHVSNPLEQAEHPWNEILASKSTRNGAPDRSDWMSVIRRLPFYHSEYTTNRHRRHSQYPFETKKLLQSLQYTSTNRCTKSKSRNEERKSSGSGTTFALRPSKLNLKTSTTSSVVSSLLGRRVRKQIRGSLLDAIPEEHESIPNAASTDLEHTVPHLQQSCSQQATTNSELNINELASYFDLYLHLPKKMSPMAEMMYT